VQISRRLSWERTAKDFVWQLASNPALATLANCRHLVVRLGIDGAIHYRRGDGKVESRLYYDPAAAEGDFVEGGAGEMLGYAAAFTAALAAAIARGGFDAVGEGTRQGVGASRRLFRAGFGSSAERL